MNNAIEHRPERLLLTRACYAPGLNRSTVSAHKRRAANDAPQRCREQSVQSRAMSDQGRTTVLEILHSDAYCDQPPAKVYQRLLEQDQCLCLVRTMHRILRNQSENGERRQQRPVQHHAIPVRAVWDKHCHSRGNYGYRLWSILMFRAWREE